MVVIGSGNSSNTLALVRTATAVGCRRVLRVNRADDLPDDLAGVVGVIAGASAPESLVEEVVERLAPRQGTEEVKAVPEDEYFPLPRELREVVRSLAAVVGTVSFAPAGGDAAVAGSPLDSRDVPAARALAELGA
jgi:4-hydroxy-3-methylbut-2-enyl diphosphate reductase